MSLAAAVIVAVLLALFGYPLRSYEFWFSWCRLKTSLLGIIYFAVAGGGGGLLGWALAQLSHASGPTDSLALNGFFYGVAGALTLRADFTPGHQEPAGQANSKPSRTRRSLDTDAKYSSRQVASALGLGLGWIQNALHDSTKEQVREWLEGMSDDSLLAQARLLRADLMSREDLTTSAKNQINTLAHNAGNSLRTNDQEKQADGRALLVGFCMKHLIQEQRSHSAAVEAIQTEMMRTVSAAAIPDQPA